MLSLNEAAALAMAECVKVKHEEAVLIVTDTNKADIAAEFLAAAKEFAASAEMAVMGPASLDGEEPPQHIAEAMLCADVVFALTTWSITHTAASKAAMEKGARLVSMPAVTAEVVEKYLGADYPAMVKLTSSLAKKLSAAKTARLTTPAGTDLVLDIAGRAGIAMAGVCAPGAFINLPDGEALVSPVSAEGILIVDGSMPPDSPSKWGVIGKVTTPIEIVIKKGKIVSISGGKEAAVLKKVFLDFPGTARLVAELGIGTNPLAEVIGNITVDEKALGTAHVAFGNSAAIGGMNTVALHLDAVVLSPTLWLDGVLVIVDGKFIA